MPKGNLLVIGPNDTVVAKASTIKTAKKEIDAHSSKESAVGKYTIVSVKEEVTLDKVAEKTAEAPVSKKVEDKKGHFE